MNDYTRLFEPQNGQALETVSTLDLIERFGLSKTSMNRRQVSAYVKRHELPWHYVAHNVWVRYS